MSLRNRVVAATTSSGARRCGNDVVGAKARGILRRLRRSRPTIVVPTCLTITLITTAALATSASAGAPIPASALAAPAVRVNQVGYPVSGPKVAYVMLARPVSTVSFEITTPYGVAYRGTSADNVGSWNSAYRAVYQLSFSGLSVAGIYQVKVTTPAKAVSP